MESFRKSSYIIPIRLEGVDNKYLLIHGYTGAIDVVDSNLKNYLFQIGLFLLINSHFQKKFLIF